MRWAACMVMAGVVLGVIGRDNAARGDALPTDAVVACVFTPLCLDTDYNGDGVASAGDVVSAVEALAAGGTPTPTPAVTATPTPTAALAALGETSAGTTAVLLQVLRAMPAVASAVTQIGSIIGAGQPTNCSGGGTLVSQCSPNESQMRDYTLGFNQCTLSTSSSTITVKGTIAAEAGAGPCAVPPTEFSTIIAENVTVTVKDLHGATTLTAVFKATGSATADFGLSTCFVSTLDVMLAGAVDVQTPGQTVSLGFGNTQVSFGMLGFSSDCALDSYRMTLTGPITFTGLSSGSLTVTFDHFNYTADAAADPNQIMLDGNLTSSCLGTTVAYATDSPILLVPSDVCPSGGELALTYLGNSERLVFGDGGSVGLDLNNDGSIDEAFDSCSATQLFLCRSVETP